MIIVFVNLLILTGMLAIWTDKLELEFNKSVRTTEFLKVIGISFLGLIIMANVISIFKKYKINSFKNRIGIYSILMLLISSYFYITYIKKIYKNRIVNGELRDVIMKKINPVEDGLGFGTKAEKLTGKEYAEITKTNWFKKLPKNAENIEYRYDYETFLNDYSFSVSYDLPKESKVDTLNYVNGSFSKKQSYKVIGNKIRVTYYELQM